MSGNSKDVCSLRDSIRAEYCKFAHSFTTIHAEDSRVQIEVIYAKGRSSPHRLLHIDPSYKRAASRSTHALRSSGGMGT